jgi:hypothetical protein
LNYARGEQHGNNEKGKQWATPMNNYVSKICKIRRGNFTQTFYVRHVSHLRVL